MKLIYIAAPYTAPTEAGVLENCAIARSAAVRLVERCGDKAFPIVPHQTGRDIEHIGDYKFWIAGTLELMRRCDAVLALPRWGESRGARAEVRDADRRGLPVFYDEALLARWIGGASVGTCHGQRGNLSELCAGLPQTLVMLEVNTGQEAEICELGKQPGDGLIYTAHTLNGIRLRSAMGAEFVQVERA
jgi:hypothetical protein